MCEHVTNVLHVLSRRSSDGYVMCEQSAPANLCVEVARPSKSVHHTTLIPPHCLQVEGSMSAQSFCESGEHGLTGFILKVYEPFIHTCMKIYFRSQNYISHNHPCKTGSKIMWHLTYHCYLCRDDCVNHSYLHCDSCSCSLSANNIIPS